MKVNKFYKLLALFFLIPIFLSACTNNNDEETNDILGNNENGNEITGYNDQNNGQIFSDFELVPISDDEMEFLEEDMSGTSFGTKRCFASSNN